jgi:hypothetical protein
MTERRPIPLLVALAIALAVAACDQPGEPDAQAPQASPQGQSSAAGPDRAPGQPVRLEHAPGVQLSSAQQVGLSRAARRFATSLTRWLYGPRRSLDVEPVAVRVRRELAHAPPYIPSDQRGTNDALAHHVDVALQTPTSGVLTVTVADSRTSYRIPASFERRNGRWQIVHLHTH